MKKTLLITLKALAVFFCVTLIFASWEAYKLSHGIEDYLEDAKTGDLIFQTQVGRARSLAIQAASLSPYNHVGIVSIENGKAYVYEASSSVRKVSLKGFVNRRGTGQRFVVYRHRNSGNQKRIISYARASLGKGYDNNLSWTDGRMYCSELAYKAYKYAGYNLDDPRVMGNMKFGLLVSSIIPHGYNSSRFKMSDNVVAPGHLSGDNNFKLVFQNW